MAIKVGRNTEKQRGNEIWTPDTSAETTNATDVTVRHDDSVRSQLEEIIVPERSDKTVIDFLTTTPVEVPQISKMKIAATPTVSKAIVAAPQVDEKPAIRLASSAIISNWDLLAKEVSMIYIDIPLLGELPSRYKEFSSKCIEHNIPFGIIFNTRVANEQHGETEVYKLTKLIKGHLPSSCVIAINVRTISNMYAPLLNLIKLIRNLGIKSVGIHVTNELAVCTNAPLNDADFTIISGVSDKPLRKHDLWESNTPSKLSGLENEVYLIRK